MSDDHEQYSDLLNRLEEQKLAIVENLQEAYTEFSNNPNDGRDKNNFQDEYNTREAKFARAIEHLVREDYDPLVFDESKNFLEYIGLLRQEISETKQLIAYKNAKIEKTKQEIEFFRNNLSALKKTTEEYEAKEKTPRSVSKEKQFTRAKAKFTELKKNLNHVLKSLYPKHYQDINSLMADITKSHLADDGSEYADVGNNVNIGALEILTTAKIISQHPHQPTMFKLTL